MTAAEQRAAVEAHPHMIVPGNRGDYDLREIALWILDNEVESQFRLSDWWNAPRRPSPFANDDEGVSPVYFLGFELELAAYRLIAYASRGETYAPLDLELVLHGGSPLVLRPVEDS